MSSFTNLLHRLGHAVKDAPVTMFPNVPHDIDGHTIETVPLILWDLAGCFLPPGANRCAHIQKRKQPHAEMLPGQNLVPDRLDKGALQAKVSSSLRGP
jgi:hypothetical protein